MTTFLLIAGLTTVLATAALVRPLFRAAAAAPDHSGAEFYAHQLDELDREAAAGLIAPAQAAASRIELQRRLLAAIGGDKAGAGRGVAPWATRLAAVAALVAAPLAAAGLYLYLGQPGLPDLPLADRGEEMRYAAEYERFNAMADSLAAKLEATPDDPAGWHMLGRSYRVLVRIDESVTALARAYALDPRHEAVGLDYAEVMLIANEGRADAAMREPLEQVLAEDAANAKARFYYGLALAAAPAEAAKALATWRALEADAPADAPWLPDLRERIEALERQAG